MWKEIADALKWLIEKRIEAKTRKKQQYGEALDALCTALNQTLIYLGDNSSGKKRHQQVHLVDAWHKAAIKLQPIKPRLAWCCHIKADYWANPKKWSEEDLKKARIKLPQIEKEIGKLFRTES